MRDMTPTERSYVAGIIDGEGSIEFTRRQRIRHERKGLRVAGGEVGVFSEVMASFRKAAGATLNISLDFGCVVEHSPNSACTMASWCFC